MITADVDLTLYPKITTHISDVVGALQQVHRVPQGADAEVNLEPIPIIGTVKLHGTHADILVRSNDEIVLQSRNVTGLTPLKDNHGFAKSMSTKTTGILQLRDLYKVRWRQLNPGATLDEICPIVIAGEWVGEKIEKGVAISQLSKRFVIISIKINGAWQRDQDYSGISLPDYDIYNVACAGVFNATLYPGDPQCTMSKIQPMAEEVASCCPFAETFGIFGGGEGIVWKLAPLEYNMNPALWFKTKGGVFKPTFARPSRQTSILGTVDDNRKAAADVVTVWCSQHKLEQGWDVLRERRIEQDLRGLNEFLKWVQQDILTEENGYIRRHKFDKIDLRIEIAKIAEPWYLARVKGGNV